MNADPLLTVRQVAEMLGLTPETIARWCAAGKLPATLPGGRRGGYRVRRSALDAYLAERSPKREGTS